MLTNQEATANKKEATRPASLGCNAAWGVSLKVAGAFSHRTLVWLAFAVALALTALPLVLLLRKGAQLTQDVNQLRLQVDFLEQQVLRLTDTYQLLSLNLDSDPKGAGDPAVILNRDQEIKMANGSSAKSRQDLKYEVVPGNLTPNKNVSSSWSARMPRATEVLPDCPKGKGKRIPPPVFMHLHGDGDSQYETATGYVTSWIEEEWCNYQPNKRFILHDRQLGGMLVTQPGLYLLYVQMAFVRFHQVGIFQIFAASTTQSKARERLIASCFVRTQDSDFNQMVTCSTTTVVCLDSHDRVYVKETDNREVVIDMQRSSSFMGLYRLYAADVKKGKRFCPRGY